MSIHMFTTMILFSCLPALDLVFVDGFVHSIHAEVLEIFRSCFGSNQSQHPIPSELVQTDFRNHVERIRIVPGIRAQHNFRQ